MPSLKIFSKTTLTALPTQRRLLATVLLLITTVTAVGCGPALIRPAANFAASTPADKKVALFLNPSQQYVGMQGIPLWLSLVERKMMQGLTAKGYTPVLVCSGYEYLRNNNLNNGLKIATECHARPALSIVFAPQIGAFDDVPWKQDNQRGEAARETLKATATQNGGSSIMIVEFHYGEERRLITYNDGQTLKYISLIPFGIEFSCPRLYWWDLSGKWLQFKTLDRDCYDQKISDYIFTKADREAASKLKVGMSYPVRRLSAEQFATAVAQNMLSRIPEWVEPDSSK